MFLKREEILKRIDKENLVSDSVPECIQGAGVDLRIEGLYELKSGAHLGVEKRELPELEEVEDFTLKPGRYYLLKTCETVNMPLDLISFMYPRSSLFRCGASLRTAVIDPGYRGQLTLGIYNEGGHDIVLEKGTRVAQMVFASLNGETPGYEGRYQGGKVK